MLKFKFILSNKRSNIYVQGLGGDLKLASAMDTGVVNSPFYPENMTSALDVEYKIYPPEGDTSAKLLVMFETVQFSPGMIDAPLCQQNYIEVGILFFVDT